MIDTKLKFTRLVVNKKFKINEGYYYIHIWGKPRESTRRTGDSSDMVAKQTFELDEFYKKFNFNLQVLTQTHGSDLIYSNQSMANTQPEADAAYSEETSMALCVKTADCMPVFFYNTGELIYGMIHAGWRGLNDKILIKTMDSISEKTNRDMSSFRFVVGPHIHTLNYETSNDVFSQFQESCTLPSINSGKRYLDMEKVLKSQFNDLEISHDDIYWLNENTFQSNNFFSHRNGETGRNFNIILFSKSELF